MSAIEKSIERHRRKLLTKKVPRRTKVPWGAGMGWPERKDFRNMEEYVAARRAVDPEYSPNSDGTIWMLV